MAPPTITYAPNQIVKDMQATLYVIASLLDSGWGSSGSGVDASSVKATIDHRDVTSKVVVTTGWGDLITASLLKVMKKAKKEPIYLPKYGRPFLVYHCGRYGVTRIGGATIPRVSYGSQGD